jgi:hypothetical protein
MSTGPEDCATWAQLGNADFMAHRRAAVADGFDRALGLRELAGEELRDLGS